MRGLLWSLALAGIAATSASAGERSDPSVVRAVELVYAVYIGGFNMVDLKIGLTWRDDSYKLRLSTKIEGLARFILPWSLRVESDGRISGDKLVPTASHTESAWRKKRRWTTLEYKDGRPVIVSAKPKPKPRSVPAEQMRGAIDPASAILSAAHAAGSPNSCSIRVPVYDGRRRFDAVFEALGEGDLPRIGRSAYSGKAEVCDFRIEVLYGRRKKTDYGGLAGGEKSMTFWFARLFDGVPPLPVRVEYETDRGGLVGHLRSARIAGGGRSRVYRLPP